MRPLEYRTKVGTEILKFLEENKDVAVSAMDISKYLESTKCIANITTVYRQLERLVEAKKVIAHSDKDGKKSLYQYVAGEEDCLSHLHIQCTECAKIIHLDCGESQDFTTHIAKEHGIVLDFSKTVIYGLCADCSKKKLG